ncbi:DUF2306 domain-containing protein [Fontisubflavum oceani]|uniref:DUF2306 domain-containing protein n=1 Tax=Fontisubflavum oceani TaxID=2978973 RepID=UPI0025B5371A|nr:DUF2306 domain-containing protein [Fontisubflavum oceani]WJY21573.1 DUF2306 domain-containing protein [Fontisubflavum oceani]
MTLEPILSAPAAVQLHMMAAVVSIALGPFAIYRRRRDRLHRMIGYAWIISMVLLAGSGLAIPAVVLPLLEPFGPIHILSIAVLYWLWEGYRHIRAGRVTAHEASMRALFWNSLGIAGAFTFLPGRRLNTAFFADAPERGYAVIAVLLCLVLARMIRQNRLRGAA